jgi:hypothetical protein
MPQTKDSNSQFNHRLTIGMLVTGLLILAAFPALSAKRVKNETIEATAVGTGSQMGQNIGSQDRPPKL